MLLSVFFKCVRDQTSLWMVLVGGPLFLLLSKLLCIRKSLAGDEHTLMCATDLHVFSWSSSEACEKKKLKSFCNSFCCLLNLPLGTNRRNLVFVLQFTASKTNVRTKNSNEVLILVSSTSVNLLLGWDLFEALIKSSLHSIPHLGDETTKMISKKASLKNSKPKSLFKKVKLYSINWDCLL